MVPSKPGLGRRNRKKGVCSLGVCPNTEAWLTDWQFSIVQEKLVFGPQRALKALKTWQATIRFCSGNIQQGCFLLHCAMESSSET